MLDKYVDTALTKVSKAHDLVGRLEMYAQPGNARCRATQ